MDYSTMLAKTLRSAHVENKDLHVIVRRVDLASLTDSAGKLFDFEQSAPRIRFE